MRGYTLPAFNDLKVEFSDKCREINVKYLGYEAEDNLLKLHFADNHYPLEITLNYQIFDGLDIISRWITLKNTGSESIVAERLLGQTDFHC